MPSFSLYLNLLWLHAKNHRNYVLGLVICFVKRTLYVACVFFHCAKYILQVDMIFPFLKGRITILGLANYGDIAELVVEIEQLQQHSNQKEQERYLLLFSKFTFYEIRLWFVRWFVRMQQAHCVSLTTPKQSTLFLVLCEILREDGPPQRVDCMASLGK